MMLMVRDSARRYRSAQDDEIVQAALSILESKVLKTPVLHNPAAVKEYLRLALGGLDSEVFGVIFLTQQHQIIEFEIMFRGSIAQTTVNPREIVKAALKRNAAAVVLAHNHPSGSPDPSRPDVVLTRTLTDALKIVDVRVLDHMIITAHAVASFAERGLI
jgi:DNA repair protein RadC